MSVRRDAFQRIGRPESGRGAGFTLIELLVVIAIIAILAAILFPVFARARENARKSTCQSNLKQIGLAFMQYAQDFDEMLPWCCAPASRTNAPNLTEKPHWRPENVATTDVRYNGLLEPYVKNRRVWVCPSCTFDVGSYAAPRRLMQSNGGCTGMAMARIVYPSEHVEASDGCNTRGLCGTNRGLTSTACQGSWGPSNVATNAVYFQRHLGGSNLLFVDGHVKWRSAPDSPGGMSQTECQKLFGNPTTP